MENQMEKKLEIKWQLKLYEGLLKWGGACLGFPIVRIQIFWDLHMGPLPPFRETTTKVDENDKVNRAIHRQISLRTWDGVAVKELTL